jgi:hypothetical protein
MILANFLHQYRDANEIVVNELIEGVMINLFYDPRGERWELATKGGIGGRYRFGSPTSNKTKSFRRMFLDAFRCLANDDLNEIVFLETLPKQYCYSFVMQHPENQMHIPIMEPKLYLVAVYETHSYGNITIIPSTIYENWALFLQIRGIIDFPKRYEPTDLSMLRTQLGSIHNDPTWMGVALIHVETGDRTTIYNKSYLLDKEDKQCDPFLLYQYLCIRRANKLDEFSHYFPMYKSSILACNKRYREWVNNVYLSYVDHYIKKNTVSICHKYKGHIENIHKTVYLPSLTSYCTLSEKNSTHITKQKVQEYLDAMEPREQYYHLS